MSKPFVFEKPIGMRDTLPPLYETRRNLRERMMNEIRLWGYELIQTPTLEYYDTVGEKSAILDRQLFKLLDMDGQTLVLRPDMTAPIARVISSTMKQIPYPIRLAYHSSVFRAQQREGGRPAEFEQVGVELIGDGTTSADAEVIALMISALKEAGLTDFKIAIGHIGVIDELFKASLRQEDERKELRRYLYEKNYVGYLQLIRKLSLRADDSNRLKELLHLRGNREVLQKAEQIVSTEKGQKALKELGHLLDVLDVHGVKDYITFDFTLISHMHYYTGIVFEGYTSGFGFPIASGGRYDQLLKEFGRSGDAIGFGVHLDDLTEALNVIQDDQVEVCIIYSKEKRNQAIKMAEEKRKEGKKTVLQEFSSIGNVERFASRFQHVIYVVGEKGGGDTHG
ncbi:ATP phosphoribosyltransferase regulatory subunit [Fictibacillus gelatini]|uniref:ATP phosphoribosyltransferase regulatory subunit n=1 Tax=Fictibacillus gelatini TaxID=225985 RepID=UPI00047E56D0|nr:ATP phosphoribosyltransferase regulatory subunit [Fictibacillus gelatini]